MKCWQLPAAEKEPAIVGFKLAMANIFQREPKCVAKMFSGGGLLFKCLSGVRKFEEWRGVNFPVMFNLRVGETFLYSRIEMSDCTLAKRSHTLPRRQ